VALPDSKKLLTCIDLKKKWSSSRAIFSFPQNVSYHMINHFLTCICIYEVSEHTNGEHMIEAFNQLNVNVACIGNNDLAMGLNHAGELMKKTNCPWVISNIVDQSNEGKPICGVSPFEVIEH
jgi:hypothetical protein